MIHPHLVDENANASVFLGTPHFGSDNAKPLHMVQTMVSALKRITLGTSLSTELAPWSTSIEDLGREFTPHVYGTIELLCFYEKVKQKIGLKYQYVSALSWMPPPCD